MSFRERLSQFWSNVQQDLFPLLENCVGALPAEYKNLASVLELVRIEDFITPARFNWGRPPTCIRMIARAFIAKAILKIPYTKQLIRLLQTDAKLRVICGWDAYNTIPSESVFSRAFAKFAETNLPDKVHQALIQSLYKDITIGHITKDSTPIIAREKCPKRTMSRKDRKKLKNAQLAKEKKEGKSRKQRQLNQSLQVMIAELPKACDIGAKTGTYGYKLVWKGYKLHVAVDDHCIPVASILTSASINDSEVAIPLAEKANQVVRNFYDLMDSAYDVEEVFQHSLSLGHVPIIDKHSRSKGSKLEKEAERKRKKLLNFSLAEEIRYRQRFSKERFNAILKDFFGGKNMFYKTNEKVSCCLSFGILSMTACTILKLIN